jgi:hypothetical protein
VGGQFIALTFADAVTQRHAQTHPAGASVDAAAAQDRGAVIVDHPQAADDWFPGFGTPFVCERLASVDMRG